MGRNYFTDIQDWARETFGTELRKTAPYEAGTKLVSTPPTKLTPGLVFTPPPTPPDPSIPDTTEVDMWKEWQRKQGDIWGESQKRYGNIWDEYMKAYEATKLTPEMVTKWGPQVSEMYAPYEARAGQQLSQRWADMGRYFSGAHLGKQRALGEEWASKKLGSQLQLAQAEVQQKYQMMNVKEQQQFQAATMETQGKYNALMKEVDAEINRLVQEVENAFAAGENEKARQLQWKIEELKDTRAQINAEAQQNASIWGSIFTGIGTVLGGPIGDVAADWLSKQLGLGKGGKK